MFLLPEMICGAVISLSPVYLEVKILIYKFVDMFSSFNFAFLLMYVNQVLILFLDLC